MSARLGLLGVLGTMYLASSAGCPARQGGGVVRECVNDADCGNSLFCDGIETCVSGACVAGASPCSDGQTCDEAADACAGGNCTSNADCTDGLFCTGVETCGAEGTCVEGADPCAAGTICDEAGDACVAEGTNVAPVAAAQSAPAGSDTDTTLTLIGSDVNGDDLTFTVTVGPSHGTLSGLDNSASAAATVLYTPANGFTGGDVFTFTVSDGALTSAPVTYSIAVSATLGPYDVAFSTYLGGSGSDTVRDVAVDRDGNIYLVGGTDSTDFPVTTGAYQTTFSSGGGSVGGAGDHDAYVTRLTPDGQLVWSTYLGGPNYDRAYAVEVDDDGNVYVGGRAGDGFPTTVGVVQPTFGGDASPNQLYGAQDGFAAKLSPDGTQLLWSTYFGGDDVSFFRDIDIDDLGRVYGILTRVSRSNPHITAGAFQTSIRGGDDGVIVRFSTDGSRVEWATYLGGSADDLQTPSIRVHTTGEVYVFGFTDSTDAPVSGDAFDRSANGRNDEYLAKLSADGAELVFGTYIGGSDQEFAETHGLILDPNGNAYVTATTKSTDFPVTSGAFQLTYGGTGGAGRGQGTNYPGDTFVAGISSDGTTLMAATFVGGADGDGSEGIGIDAEGNIYISGATYSSDFPTTGDAFQQTIGGSADFFAVKMNATLTSVLYATYLGGSGVDYGRSSIADPAGAMYVIGHGQSSNFPTANAAQPNRRGGEEGFVVKLSR